MNDLFDDFFGSNEPQSSGVNHEQAEDTLRSVDTSSGQQQVERDAQHSTHESTRDAEATLVEADRPDDDSSMPAASTIEASASEETTEDNSEELEEPADHEQEADEANEEEEEAPETEDGSEAADGNRDLFGEIIQSAPSAKKGAKTTTTSPDSKKTSSSTVAASTGSGMRRGLKEQNIEVGIDFTVHYATRMFLVEDIIDEIPESGKVHLNVIREVLLKEFWEFSESRTKWDYDLEAKKLVPMIIGEKMGGAV
ncbi:hypothetical protein SAMN04487897_109120 [Paenibacillus sp. yr247]|uniref:hypothetical protein n=1 Tax=Paenibacillus sp. yr247 TaxID=1761880 RepID=UPI0008875622|nr:hypothetical protein [Paenibacillus sp. yr247]SDO17951.1 hypothetical protein SAMN04487897_109120 [Paenibacillus sp. yr247]